MVIVFGRPGAGKTTVANQAADLVLRATSDDDAVAVLALDLDVCVPQWMRDNFAQGLYPTLAQRIEFANEACQHVMQQERQLQQQQQQKEQTTTTSLTTTIVSFSFVNTDLRDVFREAFPHAQWILIDTTEDEAQRRMEQRDDHFYKGDGGDASDNDVEEEAPAKKDDSNNSDWDFAPVTFDHVKLPGSNSIDVNAQQVADIVKAMCQQEAEAASSSL